MSYEHRARWAAQKRVIDRENRLLARIAEVKRLVRGGMSIKEALASVKMGVSTYREHEDKVP